MSAPEGSPSVVLVQRQDYQFEHHYAPELPVLLADEPAPLGTGQGPDPVELLASAVGNCLSASLLFAFRKYKQAPDPLRAEVRAQVGRNERNRMRVLGLDVQLTLGVPAASLEHVERVLGSFEDYCTVTQSITGSVPVALTVMDSTGAVLKAPAAAAG
ncbi:MAG: OsmC family peroxiredoxin [Roseateles sp.]|nr:MAG: OsmC family peroxiredoxin [Roseateles sp.]